MPELPEVETVMRALRARLQDRLVTSLVQRRAELRFPLPAGLEQSLRGRRLTAFARRAKFIRAETDDGQTLLLHLGMSGRLLFDGGPAGPHEHLTFTFEDGTILRFVDPRRFGMLDLCPTGSLSDHRWLRHLGLEPLAAGFDGEVLRERLAGSRTAIKMALMDQKLVVGVGNIYASEALFRARISPRRLARSLGRSRAGRLAEAVRTVLTEAIEAGGSSLRDYVQANGELGTFQRGFRVYDRAGLPCVRCDQAVQRLRQGSRATFYCAECQR